MSSTRQAFLPGHPQPTPEWIERDSQIRQAFIALGQTLQPVLEFLPRGSKSLTIEKNIQGFHYKVTITPVEEK
jgi:hypothetical protein